MELRTGAVRLPSVAELMDSAYVFSIPLRMPFRGVRHREGMVFQGPSGWAEFAPFPEYADAEAAMWLQAAVEAGWGTALAAVRELVPVNATVPAVPASEVPAVLDRFPGCRTAKVKVAEPGQGLDADLDRVAAVRDYWGPHAAIRVDANGAWDLDQARHALRALSAYNLEYAEQPVAQVADLARVRRALARDGVNVLVAADESIRRAADPLLVARTEAADVVVIKVAPLGGARRAVQIVADCGLPAVVSSALDTSVGIASAVALAAALPTLPYACGVGTVALLDGDVTPLPLLPRDGVLTVADSARSVNAMTLGHLSGYRAPTDRVRWWSDRLRRCAGFLE